MHPRRGRLSRVVASVGLLVGLSSVGGPAAISVAAPALKVIPLAQLGPRVPHRMISNPSGCISGQVHCYTPDDIASAYGVDTVHTAGLTGAGQTIVIVDSYGSPPALSDLQMFSQTFGLPAPNLTIHYPCGRPTFNNSVKGSPFGWAVETSLDLQWAHAIAPDAHLVLVAANPAETQGVQGLPCMLSGEQWAIQNYPGSVISQSFGTSELAFQGAAPAVFANFDKTYRQAEAAGMSVLAAAGDWGSANFSKRGYHAGPPFSSPNVIWPASDPLVTAAGGTWLQYGWTWDPTISADDYYACLAQNPSDSTPCDNQYLNSVPGSRTEAVWKEDWLPASTGGGLSRVYSTPSFQSGISPSILQGSRGIPDVSWNAAVDGGVLTYLGFIGDGGNGFYIIGGTSASTPELSGVIALANQARANANKGPIGYLNPVLYSLPSGDYNDIVPQTFGTGAGVTTLDNNQLFGTSAAGMPTTPGYDLTTGLGVPNVPAFVGGLAAAP
jgi:subtilase family serine protease